MRELVVPVHVEALTLTRPQRMVGPTADHEIRPWSDGTRDHNAGTPHVASAINAEPFADHAHWLAAGVHLHWALPDALTHGTTTPTDGYVQSGDLWFPPAPNRWTVTRHLPNQPTDAAWLVESDYLHPPGGPRPAAATVYPVDLEDGSPSFRFIGRTIPLDPQTLDWELSEETPSTTTIEELGLTLTAVGPGDPSFAALYTGCQSVFGMHDPSPISGEGTVMYEVFGVYGGDSIDPLANAFNEHTNRPDLALQRLAADLISRGEAVPEELSEEDRAQAWRLEVRDRFGWSYGQPDDVRDVENRQEGSPFAPERMICLGRVNVMEQPSQPAKHVGLAQDSIVVVASTPADAAATLLANRAGLPDDQAHHDRWAQALRGSDLTDHALDLQAKIAEAAHTDQFQPVPGERRWAIVGSGEAGTRVADLPGELVYRLDELNDSQSRFDRLRATADAGRQQAFDDWHAYQVAAYPELDTDGFPLSPDAIAAVLRTEGLEPLDAVDQQLQLVGGAVADGHAVVLSMMHTAAVEDDLVLVPGARYYRPHDPVVMIDHAGAHATTRHGHDNLPGGDGLSCEGVITGPFADFVLLAAGVDELDGPFERTQSADPWNPLWLEWEVEIRPTAHATENLAYTPDTITSAFRMTPTEPDLLPDPGPQLADGFEYLSGRTIITPGAGRVLADRLEAIVSTRIADRAEPSSPTNAAAAVDDTITSVIGDIASTIDRAIAWIEIQDLRRSAVLQLGGFGDALLMHRQELQIGIADPIGQPVQQELADRVRLAVGDLHPTTPIPDAAFRPIQAGEMVIERLRLVDTFGQSVQWHPQEVIAAPRLRGLTSGHLALPPRITQAARLDFRWLSGSHHGVHTNDHPASSPICGWLLPNELDGSLAVYDADGRSLGSVADDGVWRPGAGSMTAPAHPDQIDNVHLAEVITWLVRRHADDGQFVDHFHTVVQAALDGIDPADAAHHAPRAVLVGRPVAVVRARLGIELKQPPATDASSAALRRRRDGTARDHSFTTVAIPIGLGEHHQLGDGLVGYWVEDTDGSVLNADFVTPQPDDRDVDVPGIVMNRNGTRTTIDRSIADPPTTVTMLMDPRGSVHATTGVLPTKSVSIPSKHYVDALHRLRVTFRMDHVLTPPGSVEIAVPAEPGFSWSWIQREGRSWVVTPHHPTVHREAIEATFGPRGQAVWAYLVHSRRIMLDEHADLGLLMPPDPSAPTVDQAVPGLTTELLENNLHALAAAIGPAERRARFGDRAVARSGWLQLRPTPSHNGWGDQPLPEVNES